MENKWWKKNVDGEIHHVIVELKSKLSGKEIKKDWTEDLSLSYEHVDVDMENIPSILAFWCAVLAEARKEKSLIGIMIDVKKSKILEGTKDLIKEGIKLTVSDKENIICVDPDYIKLRKREIDLDATISKLFGVVDALKIKADNLRSFAAMKRAELHNS